MLFLGALTGTFHSGAGRVGFAEPRRFGALMITESVIACYRLVRYLPRSTKHCAARRKSTIAISLGDRLVRENINSLARTQG
jgi:hypothetical protein